MGLEKVYFHVDLDAFYASVEQHDHPEYRGQPVIIGALPGQRGVVSACSYEARKFGIRSAMPISQAYRRCRHGVYLVPRMGRYQEISDTVMDILRGFAPDVRQISIDEATLDMSGTSRIYGPPESAAALLKGRVNGETGLSISVGIAPNRYLSKLASEYDKPDGLYRILPGGEEEFLDGLELGDLWGLGKKTLERLYELNIRTVPQLRSFPENTLRSMLGNGAGSYLYRVVRGYDPGIYALETKSRSLSAEITFGRDTGDRDVLLKTLLDLSHHVMNRSMKERYRSKTVTLKLRYSDFTTTTVQKTLRHLVTSAEEVYTVACELLEKRWNGTAAIRLIGLGLSAMEESEAPEQNELFEDAFDRKKRVEEAIFKLQGKRPESRVLKASLLKGGFRHSRTGPDEGPPSPEQRGGQS